MVQMEGEVGMRDEAVWFVVDGWWRGRGVFDGKEMEWLGKVLEEKGKVVCKERGFRRWGLGEREWEKEKNDWLRKRERESMHARVFEDIYILRRVQLYHHANPHYRGTSIRSPPFSLFFSIPCN